MTTGIMGSQRLDVRATPSMDSELLETSEKQSPVRRVTNTLTRRGHSWTAEILALILSASTLGTICIILPWYDGRPLSTWTFILSLNTVVSILGAVSRASMGFALSAAFGQEKWNWYRSRDDKLLTFDRFDEATRGPLGSLKLLWHLKFRHWTALGALTMAVLLGFEPFLQSLIILEGQLVSVAPGQSAGSVAAAMNQQPATISRSAGTLDLGRYMSDINGIPPNEKVKLDRLIPKRNATTADYAASLVSARYFSRPDFGLTAAVIAGLGSTSNATGQAWNPSFSCSSGNCTWAPYTSLGVCSRCNDISSSIRSSRGVGNWCSYASKPGCNSPVTIKWSHTGGMVPGYEELNYTSHVLATPGAKLLLSNWHLPYAATACPLCETATLVADTLLSPELTLSFRNLTSMIISWVYMAADPSYSTGKTAWADTAVTANECALYFCTQALQSRVENGQLTEQVLGTWAQRRPFVPPQANFSSERQIWDEMSELGEFSEASWVPWLLSATGLSFGADYGANNSTIQLFISRSDLAAQNITIPDLEREGDVEFNITRATVGALTRYLAMDLSGLQARYFSDNRNASNMTQLIYPPDFYGNVISNGPTPPIINRLGESTNITEMMANVARSMTKFLREYQGPDESAAQGQQTAHLVLGETQFWVLHIRVRWAYLALPAGVLLVGCAVVVAVMIRSRGLGLPAWKGSSLVTLARGLDAPSRERLRAADIDPRGLRSKGRKMRVKLVDGDDGMGMQLVQVGTGGSWLYGQEDGLKRRVSRLAVTTSAESLNG